MEIVNKNTTTNDSNVSKDTLLESLQEKDQQITQLTQQLSWFEEQFKLLKSKHYAKSSEKQSAFQSQLFDEDEEVIQDDLDNANKETIIYTRTKSNRSNKYLDTSHLPREKKRLDLSDAEKQCICGLCMEQFGEESREEIIYQPATLKVIEYIRLKYKCRHCETVKMPKAVELPLAKSKASASLITEVILNKCRYHLPFYRQSKMLAMLQLKIPDNTLAGWVMNVG